MLEAQQRAHSSRPGEGAPSKAVDGSSILPVAATLFRALNAAGVRYGVIQDLAGLRDALAGRDDLDVLLDKQDYPAFLAIMGQLHALRGVSLSCYDNVCAGREDWFVPDFSRGAYLHLDTHIGVRVGWEFRKRYLAFDHMAIARWDRISLEGTSIPVVSPEDEIRIALARFAFRMWALPWTPWLTLRGEWKTQLARLSSLPGERGLSIIHYTFGRSAPVSCRIRQTEAGLAVHRGDLARLRRSIREKGGFARGFSIADPAVHIARKATYLFLRLVGRLMPGSVPAKRRPYSGGLVVAIVGPDGLGKSTQAELLTRAFRWKFGCAQLYVGTGEGDGWWLRKGLQRLVFPHRRQLKAKAQRRNDKQPMHGIYAAALAFWGVLIAIERYVVVMRAHRLATRGLIVVCDRWPQMLRFGYLDGPMIPSGMLGVRGLGALARFEQKLYRKMEECRPHLTLHLVCDHAVSERRKPGEISREAFEARLALMAELRASDKQIRTIDASASVDEVGRELFREIWLSL